jgi:3-isopropylmalate dehydratase small subunit
MTQLVRSGRVWKFGKNISTDLLMPGAIIWKQATTPEERKAAIMPNRPGWAANDVRAGDIIVADTNFGCGSSRSAPRVLQNDLGISCVVAESFSRLFLRNALNLGFPILVCPGIFASTSELDNIEVHFDDGHVFNRSNGQSLVGEAYPPDSPPGELLRMGGLRPYLERWIEDHPEVTRERAEPDSP